MTTDAQEKRRLINAFDQCATAGGNRIVIYYDKEDTGRGGHGAKWHISRIENGTSWTTDERGAWYDYGKKTFTIFGADGETHHEQKANALKQAIQWANKRFGKREFVKNREGNYVEKEVNEKFPLPKKVRAAKKLALDAEDKERG